MLLRWLTGLMEAHPEFEDALITKTTAHKDLISFTIVLPGNVRIEGFQSHYPRIMVYKNQSYRSFYGDDLVSIEGVMEYLKS